MKSNLIDNRQIRVFISSTFQDMQDERDYLMKRTFPMLRKLAAERDVTLTELDLRWGITEEEAKSGKVVEICLREIENSILLQSYEDDFGKDFVKQILALIAVSRRGLSEDEILAITNYKQLYWSQFYCAFASHLNAKNGLFYFSHRYVQNAVWRRYLDKTDWEHSCRMAIIEEMSRDNNIRAYAELPFQYEAVGDYDSLCHQLLNLDVFRFQYKNYEYELASYWRKLFDHGYDCAIYKEKLKKADSLDGIYDTISSFFQKYFSLYDFSLSLSEILLEIRGRFLGQNHPDTAMSYNNIGTVYSDKSDYDKALEYYLKAMEIRESVLGANHPGTAGSYHNIGAVYRRKCNYDKVLEYNLKAMEIREKVLGEDHINTVYSYNDIAWTYHLLGKYDDALSYVEKTVKVSLDDANIIDTLATVYQGLGRYDEAMEQFELCLKLQKEENASEDSIRDTEEKMEELKKIMKN